MHKSGLGKKVKNKISAIVILSLALSLIFNNAYSLVRTSVSTGNWNQTSTWDCGCVPASTDSVVIANNTSVTITANTTVTGLLIQSNASLYYGTGAGFTLTLNKNFKIESGGALSEMNQSDNIIKIAYKPAYITVNGTATVNRLQVNAGSNGTLYFFGSGTFTVRADLEVYGANPKVYLYYATLNINGNIVDNGSGTFQWQQRDYSTLNLGGDMNDVDDLYTWTVNTINYNGKGDQLILCPTAPSYFWNLTISGSGTKTLGPCSGGSYNDIHGNLTINAGCTLDVSTASYDIHLSGDWINEGGTFNPRNATVVMEWSNPQTISCMSGNETFHNLTVNKSAADISLSNNITITNILNLTSGDIVLNTGDLILGTGCMISGTPGNSSYVQADKTGFMKRNLSSAGSYMFPVGDNDEYSPYTIDIHNATFSGGDFISLKVTDAVHPMVTSENRISRYWSVNSEGLSENSYDFSCQYLDADVEGTESDIYTARIDGLFTNYELVNTSTNTLYSNANISALLTNNDFTGRDDGTLPVELIAFTAIADDEGINIAWQTASETNNDFFTIEKSMDGLTFVTAAVFEGAGNSNSLQNYSVKDYYPYEGISYYRLKQTDFDGQFSYSSVVSVFFEDKDNQSIIIFPSPSSDDYLYLSFKYNSVDTAFLNIYDINGACILQKTIHTLAGENNATLNTSGFAKGKYIIQIIGFNRTIISGFIKY